MVPCAGTAPKGGMEAVVQTCMSCRHFKFDNDSWEDDHGPGLVLSRCDQLVQVVKMGEEK